MNSSQSIGVSGFGLGKGQTFGTNCQGFRDTFCAFDLIHFSAEGLIVRASCDINDNDIPFLSKRLTIIMKRLPRPESDYVNHVTFSQIYRHLWKYLNREK